MLNLGGRLARRIGRRGTTLLVFAVIDAIIGWSLLDPSVQPARVPAYRVTAAVAPFAVWGWLWIAVGLTCLGYAFVRTDRAGFAAAVSVKLVWSSCFFATSLFYGVPRAWLGGVTWGLVAALVFVISGWPEPRRGR
jgi:hypothetical protein